jgi:hypothetical protein
MPQSDFAYLKIDDPFRSKVDIFLRSPCRYSLCLPDDHISDHIYESLYEECSAMAL